MSRRKLGTAIALLASLGVFTGLSQAQLRTAKRPATKPATSQNMPPEYQAGINELRSAKGYLEKAGDKWGGYRVKGIASQNGLDRKICLAERSHQILLALVDCIHAPFAREPLADLVARAGRPTDFQPVLRRRRRR